LHYLQLDATADQLIFLVAEGIRPNLSRALVRASDLAPSDPHVPKEASCIFDLQMDDSRVRLEAQDALCSEPNCLGVCIATVIEALRHARKFFRPADLRIVVIESLDTVLLRIAIEGLLDGHVEEAGDLQNNFSKHRNSTKRRRSSSCH
jgi:hypothetical protein